MKSLRIGIIGFDTSHVTAFTKILNDDKYPFHVDGGKVVAGYPSFSPDVYASYSRIENFKREMIEKWNVVIVDSIEKLLEITDAILLLNVDGRRHLKEAIPVLKSKKPLFIDKPLSYNYFDAKKIAEFAKEYNCPIFSSSSLRFDYNTQQIKKEIQSKDVIGCDSFSPCPLESTNPGLFWYGVHGVEILYTFMGIGCKSLICKSTVNTHFVIGKWNNNKIGTIRGIRKSIVEYGATVYLKEKVYQVVYSKEIPIYSQLLMEIIKFFYTGISPVNIEETLEIMKFMQCAIISENKNREVFLDELN